MPMTLAAAVPAREAPPAAFPSVLSPASSRWGDAARVIHFNADRSLVAPRMALSAPGSEEAPEQTDIGAVTDRIELTCA